MAWRSFIFFKKKLSNEFCDRFECSFFPQNGGDQCHCFSIVMVGEDSLQAKGRLGALGEYKLLSIDGMQGGKCYGNAETEVVRFQPRYGTHV